MPAKLRKVLRRDVVTVREGRVLGRPADILMDPDRHEVALLVVSYGAVPDTALVVPASAVQSFEADRLAVESLDSLVVAGRDEKALAIVSRGFTFRKRPVLTSRGTSLGKIASVMIDDRGRVVEYRVRKGLLGYLRPTLKIAPSALGTPGGEVAVVREPPESSRSE